MKRKMTAAIIGIGYIGKEHLAVLKEKVSRIIICDPNEKESSAFAKLKSLNFNKKTEHEGVASVFCFLVEMTRFELATSTSRT